MSERQARLNRKSAPAPVAPKRGKGSVVLTVAAVVIALAVAGVGGYAVWDKIGPEPPVVTTVADVAEQKGMTAEELIEKSGVEGITPETDYTEVSSKLTLAGYAAIEGKTAEELKKEYKIESLADDMLWIEASAKVPMSVVAAENGTTFEEFAKQNSLPETITADTTYEEAMQLIQEMATPAE